MSEEEPDVSPVQAYILLLAGAKDGETINTRLGEEVLDFE